MKKLVPLQPLVHLMKLSLLQALLAVIFAGASLAFDANAQELLNKRVTFRLENQGLRKVLKEIETQTNIRFAFRPREIPISLKVTVVAANESLGDVLDRVVKPLRLRYEVVGRQIVLSPVGPADETRASFQAEAIVPAELTVSGTIADETGQTLPGVNVVVKGTNRGTTSDVAGTYRLSVPEANAVLIFSYVGYEPKEVAVGNQTTINVILKADNKSLNEVIVIGYGAVKKRDLTGAVASIGTAELTAQPISSFNQALQGRVSGVQVTNSSNAPGGASPFGYEGVIQSRPVMNRCTLLMDFLSRIHHRRKGPAVHPIFRMCSPRSTPMTLKALRCLRMHRLRLFTVPVGQTGSCWLPHGGVRKVARQSILTRITGCRTSPKCLSLPRLKNKRPSKMNNSEISVSLNGLAIQRPIPKNRPSMVSARIGRRKFTGRPRCRTTSSRFRGDG
ncbi:TonB-dependent receptor plug domain-containing protein [Spirosoma sp. HMF3257]|uniref:TonB-dependent receptor plug domain-containing protein n=1 Tax=Spirosoma telluris TaxID=2183553 RepID=A0A327NJM2_9BACT|nr:TonB-dependent receptor plug domain-containing protein [Spirosoma telluris]RAI75580.1 hypothetical protein HMF3257_17975 [Spirosoma telluris]